MKYYSTLIALILLPLGLLAQSRPAARKSAGSATRPSATRPVATRTTAPKKSVVAPRPAVTQASATQQRTVYTSQPVAHVAPSKAKESMFRIGLRLGGNSGTIGGVEGSPADGVQTARIMGFHGGVVVNIGGPLFSVQPELLFSQYGIKLTQGADYLQVKYNVVEMPILVKASFGERPDLRFFVNAGPVFSYAASGTVSAQQSGQSDSQAMDLSQQGRFAFGLAGGVGVALKAGPGSLLLEGRYSYLMRSQDDGTKTSPQNLMLSVGYLFPLSVR